MLSQINRILLISVCLVLVPPNAFGSDIPQRSFSEKLDLADAAKAKFSRSCGSGRLRWGFGDDITDLEIKRVSFNHKKGILNVDYVTAESALAEYELDFEIPTSLEAIAPRPMENGITISCKASKNCIEIDWRVGKGKWQRDDTDQLAIECHAPLQAANAMVDFQNYTKGIFKESFQYENALRSQFESKIDQIRLYGGESRQSKLTVQAEFDQKIAVVIGSECDGTYELLFNGSEASEYSEAGTDGQCSYRFIKRESKEEYTPSGLYNDHMYQLDALKRGAYEIRTIREEENFTYIHFVPTIDFYQNVIRKRTKTQYIERHFLHGAAVVEIDHDAKIIKSLSWGVSYDKERDSWFINRPAPLERILGPNEGSYSVSEEFSYVPSIDAVVLKRMEMRGSPVATRLLNVIPVGFSISLGIEMLNAQPTQGHD